MKKYTQEEALKILAENFCTKVEKRGQWICFSKIDDVEVKFRTNDEEWVTGRLLGDDATNEDNYELRPDRNIRGAESLARLLSHDYISNVIVSDNDNVYILTEDEMLNMSNQDIQDLYEDIVK